MLEDPGIDVRSAADSLNINMMDPTVHRERQSLAQVLSTTMSSGIATLGNITHSLVQTTPPTATNGLTSVTSTIHMPTSQQIVRRFTLLAPKTVVACRSVPPITSTPNIIFIQTPQGSMAKPVNMTKPIYTTPTTFLSTLPTPFSAYPASITTWAHFQPPTQNPHIGTGPNLQGGNLNPLNQVPPLPPQHQL